MSADEQAANERVLFLTGRLAQENLKKILAELRPLPFGYEVRDLGLQVAGLMTADMIQRRLPAPLDADRVVVPGRCRGDLEALSRHYGIPFERGPDELKDLPQHLGRKGKPVDLSRYDTLIFAEIVEASGMSVDAILARAERYRRDGADVIDIGCLPNTAFPHLEDSVQALKRAGFTVSVDSLDRDELIRGGKAGADYVLSLKEDTLDLLDQIASAPILIPSHPGDLDSLARAIEHCERIGRRYFADPILEPIHFGFTDSIVRYRDLRKRFPDAPILMGVGNVTELTDADTSGINAVLFGIISELNIGAILTTEVSNHARRAVKEADAARRMMHAAREENALPRKYSEQLMTVHARKPFPDSPEEIAALAAQIKDPSYRIQIAADGVHIYNRAGHHVHTDVFELFPKLGVEKDGAHAFYLGAELARAQIAWQLGKRYYQDEELDWGAATDRKPDDNHAHRNPGATLRKDESGGSS